MWQGRFKSWYVANEAYLYILMRYIEQNPLKVKIVEKIEYYPYSSSYYFYKEEKVPVCLQNSWIIKTYGKNIKEIKDFFTLEIDSADLKKLIKASSLVDAPDIDKKVNRGKLIKFFDGIKDKQTRNKYIVKAYEQGYSQYVIARIIGISQPAVNKIIKRSS